MKVLITDFAKLQLTNIYDYYKLQGFGKYGRSIRKEVINKALMLRDFPNMGVIEPNLIEFDLEHRYVLVKNYKVIYRQLADTIIVTDIFDTRKDPKEMMP
jgi:toxin ParE1/3/4